MPAEQPTRTKLPRARFGTSAAARCGAISCAIWLAAPAAPQTITYADVTATRLPAGLAGACMDAASGDADGDGDLDLALAMEFEPNLLLLNDGDGAFTLGVDRLPVTIHDSEDVAFADFDGDGDLDLVLVSEDDLTNELYLNDGTGRFSDVSDRIPVEGTSNALAVLDIDRDGAPDLLIGNVGVNRALINDGLGRFLDATAEIWPQQGLSRTQDIELADVDADGDLDVVVGNEGQNELFLNEAGRLVDATAGSLPVWIDETREIRAVDVDGDRDLDLVVANVAFVMSEPPRDYVLLNDGSGSFRFMDAARFPEGERNNFTVQAADLDGDDDYDVLLPSTDLDGVGDLLVLRNDGAGRFAIAGPGSLLPALEGNGFDIEVADFDADGVSDLFFCNRASSPYREQAAVSGGLARLLRGIRFSD
jgi:FG-GAP-like repeat